jgi:cardiolipin synthase A/B
VRVILDANLERRANTPAYDKLAAAGVKVEWAPPRFAATHEKAIVVDDRAAAILTLNLTSRYYADTRDFAVLDSDPGDVAAIEAVFSADFAGGSTSEPSGDDLVWSPGQSATALVDLISSARKRILVENEELSDHTIVDALVADASRGVEVDITMTADREWDADFRRITAAGGRVHTLAADAALYIHAKAVQVDPGTPADRCFVGSENMSAASLDRNRELGLITADPSVCAPLTAALEADFSAAPPFSG